MKSRYRWHQIQKTGQTVGAKKRETPIISFPKKYVEIVYYKWKRRNCIKSALHILPYPGLVPYDIYLLLTFKVTLVLTCEFKSLVTPITFVSYKRFRIL